MTATGRSVGNVGDGTGDGTTVAFRSPSDAGIDVVAGSVDATPLTRFVASVEPGVVFTSLAAQCVPDLCDDCSIDIVDGGEACFSIVFPPRTTCTGGLLRIADRVDTAPDHRVRVPFSYPGSTPGTPDDEHRQDAAREAFHGVAIFAWHRRIPTRSDRTAAVALVDRAVHTVVLQRSEQAAAMAAANVAHLQLALQNSRRLGAAIGVLMTLHTITEDQAFDLLARAGQRSHRKVRDIAGEVLRAGRLDPALLMRATATSDHAQDDNPADSRADESPS